MIPITVFNILPRSNCFYWAFWLWKPFFHCKQSGSSQWALAPSGEKYCALVNNSENLFIPWICWSAVLVRGLALQRERAAAWLFAIRERLHFSSELNQQVLTSPSVLLPAGLELSEQRGWLRKSGHRPRGPNTLPCHLNTREILLAGCSCLVVPKWRLVLSATKAIGMSLQLHHTSTLTKFVPIAELCCLNSLLVFWWIFVGFQVEQKGIYIL